MSSDENIFEEYNLDPWGNRRNPNDWSYNNVPAPQITDRGFTCHEHLDDFGLINMNGRMYDPVLGRFLGVDPVVADITSSQAFNGYSYCSNNPLKYIDPSGYTYLQNMKDAYNGVGSFYYRGGIYQMSDGGGWGYYRCSTGGGSFQPQVDLGYEANHIDPFHTDNQGNLRDSDGNIVESYMRRGNEKYGHWEREEGVYAISLKWMWNIPQAGLVKTYDPGQIRQWDPNLMDRWSESNSILGNLSYKLFDGIAVTLQSFIRSSKTQHLTGEPVNGNDRVDAFVNTVSWAIPVGETTSFRTIPNGVFSSRWDLRLQVHSHSLSPLEGRGISFTMSPLHLNVNNTHVIFNPIYWPYYY